MTRDEIFWEIYNKLIDKEITPSNKAIDITDFILANFVPKSKEMWSGKIFKEGYFDGRLYLGPGDLVDICEENNGKHAILIIKGEE